MIKDRTQKLVKQRLGSANYDPLYPIEFNSEPQNPVNVDKLTKFPVQTTQVNLSTNYTRIPMK